MKRILAVLLLLTPSLAFAQTIPFSSWPDAIYCTMDNGDTFALKQWAFPSVDGIFSYEVSPRYQVDFLRQYFDSSGTNTASNWPTDCDGSSISALVAQGKAFYNVQSTSPKTLPDVVAKRKTANESVASSASLHDDTQLSAAVKSGKSYVVEGTLFVSATTATPDAKIAFTAPTGSDITIGYTSNEAAGSSGELEVSGTASDRIPLPANTKVPVHMEGTVVAGADGTLQLRWAQFTSNAATLTVGKGSYLRIEEIQ